MEANRESKHVCHIEFSIEPCYWKKATAFPRTNHAQHRSFALDYCWRCELSLAAMISMASVIPNIFSSLEWSSFLFSLFFYFPANRLTAASTIVLRSVHNLRNMTNVIGTFSIILRAVGKNSGTTTSKHFKRMFAAIWLKTNIWTTASCWWNDWSPYRNGVETWAV